MELGIVGRVAVVTGGTRGIGAAVAERLESEGARVVRVARSEGIDVTAPDAAERIAERAAGPVDILVNNAGTSAIQPLEEMTDEHFYAAFELNVMAPMRLMRHFAPEMAQRGWGRIVNVSSIFGVVSKEQRAAYSASKFALDGMTAALAAEAASDGVLANCVAPGFIDTELTRHVLGEAGMAEMAMGVPARRLGRPEEVAELVAWLAGPRNSYVSGQNVVVDGGFTRT